MRGDAARWYRWIPRQSATFTPERPVVLTLRTNWPGDVSLTLYRVPRTQAIALAMSGQSVQFDRLVPDKIIRTIINPANASRALTGSSAGYQLEDGFEHRADLGVLPVGRYAALWHAGDARGIETVDVSSVGMYVLADPAHGLVASALDLRTMLRRDNVKFTLYRPEGAMALKQDASGLASLTERNLLRSALVADAPDGSMAIVTVGQAEASQIYPDYENVIVQTDRPLYRAGQIVHFRAIYRTGEVGSYRIPSGARNIQLFDGRNHSIEQKSLTLDEFGTIGGDFQLPSDAPLGAYRFESEHASSEGSFRVEAYRRAEYLIDFDHNATHVIGGDPARFGADVRYFFGRPAGGMKLHYDASVEANYFFGAYRIGAALERSGLPSPAPTGTPVPDVLGDLAADANGHVSVVVPTRPVDEERTLSLTLDARDASGHTVSGRSRVLITPASFYLRIEPQSHFFDAGSKANLKITSIDYDGMPRPGVEVNLSFALLRYDEVGRTWKHVPVSGSDQVVRTGNDGTTALKWVAPAGGWFEATAVARDEAGRRTVARHDFWVFASSLSPAFHFDSARVVAQRDHYAPGEPATLLVTVPRADVDALVSVSAGAQRTVRLYHLPSIVSSITVQPPLDAASYSVTVAVPTSRSMVSAGAVVNVDPPPHRLQLEVTPDRAGYEPGSAAHFAITVRDYKNRPLRAQVAIGIVDDALYALSGHYGTHLFDRYYARDYGYFAPDVTWFGLNDPSPIVMASESLLTIGHVGAARDGDGFQPTMTADTYSVEPAFEDIRKDFRETAFWSPNVVTGSDGRATVSFNWPDSLTSYTADASAITTSTDAGDTSIPALVTKDFLVRLEIPRYLRLGDRANIVGIAQGRAGVSSAALRFAAPAFGVEDVRSDVALDRYATGSASWEIEAKSIGSGPLRLAGASGNQRDAMELPLSVERTSTIEHVRNAGRLPDSSRFALSLPQGYESGALRVDLSPSLVGELVQSSKLLQVYPYECTEQTMSSALPAAFIGKLAKRFALSVTNMNLDDIADRAISRLTDLQHADGSWGWWDHDGDHPFMTAYALYGLAELRDAGYNVGPWYLQKGRDGLLAQLEAADGKILEFWDDRAGSQWNTRAFMLFALAKVSGKDTDRSLFRDTDAHLDALKPYGLAVFGLAHHFAGDDAAARAILQRLETTAIQEGDFIHWQGDSWQYRWEDDPIEATAYALRLIVALSPDSPRIPKIVAWLQSQQHGSWWYTTKDTAAAIGAISETIKPGSGEFDPHETVRVLLDGKPVKSVRFDSTVPGGDASFAVPAATLANGSILTVEREGSGAVYWSTDWTRYVPANNRSAGEIDPRTLSKLNGDAEPGLSIERRYSVPHGGPWRVGDEVDVQIDLHFKRDQEYVAIEDAFPAGLESQPLQYETGYQWSGIQFFDDRAVFFVTRAAAGDTVKLTYRLRAMTAGSFTAPAPTAYAMYGPPITAIGTAERISVAREAK
jgi:uncharacterized protein YfaS (alpha-2-macroglobulin family)